MAGRYIAESGDRPEDLFGRRAIAVMQGAIARAAAGDSAGAVADGERAIATFNRSVDAIDGRSMHWLLALVYTYAGRRASPVEQLGLALQVPMGVMPNDLRLNPLWDPLRGDPQFERLAAGGGS